MKTTHSNQRGVAWIEISMIIFILGIISMIAVPRFYNFQPPNQPEATTGLKH